MAGADVTKELQTYLRGRIGNDRIYTNTIKESAKLPFVGLLLVRSESTEHLQGISGVAYARVEIVAYAADPAGAYDLAEQIRLAPLQMFRGQMANLDVLTVTSEFDAFERGYDKPVNGAPAGRWYVSRDFEIWYREATA